MTDKMEVDASTSLNKQPKKSARINTYSELNNDKTQLANAKIGPHTDNIKDTDFPSFTNRPNRDPQLNFGSVWRKPSQIPYEEDSCDSVMTNESADTTIKK